MQTFLRGGGEGDAVNAIIETARDILRRGERETWEGAIALAWQRHRRIFKPRQWKATP